MSKRKFISAAKRGESWTEHPPRSVRVGSAEGYIGRLPGLETPQSVRPTDEQMRLLAEGARKARTE